jgi:hypothetical protein
VKKNLSLWQNLEGLQKKKAELENQLLAIGEKERAVIQVLRTIDEDLGIKEERAHKLEVQLKERQEAIVNLESRIAGMELILKNPLKEQVNTELVKEEPLEESAEEETDGEQPVEVTVQTTDSDDICQQIEETKTHKKREKARYYWTH